MNLAAMNLAAKVNGRQDLAVGLALHHRGCLGDKDRSYLPPRSELGRERCKCEWVFVKTNI